MSVTKEGTVNELGLSTKGKQKIKIDGQWYFAGRCKLDGVSPGDRLSYEASAFGERGDLWGLDKWAKLPPLPASNGHAKSNPAVSDDAEMRFISNCVGQAIAAGTIKDPSEIEKWYAAARSALHSQSEDYE